MVEKKQGRGWRNAGSFSFGHSGKDRLGALRWGANPYITLFARGSVSREAADKAAATREIHELPSARGCTYVVPACDFALALKVGQGFGDEAEIQIAVKYLGVTEKEIEKLMEKCPLVSITT